MLSNIPVPLGSKGWPGEPQLFLELIIVCIHFTRNSFDYPVLLSAPERVTSGWEKEKGSWTTWHMVDVSCSCETAKALLLALLQPWILPVPS